MSVQEHNNPAKDVARPENMDYLLAEYSALREEIVKRIEIGYQLIALTLTGFGIILTIGLQTKAAPLLFVYPFLVLVLSTIWTNNDMCIVNIGNYIRRHIEPWMAENAMGWENKLPHTWRRLHLITDVGPRAVFISTTLLAILIGLLLATFNVLEKVLLILDALCILFNTILFVLTTTRKMIYKFILNNV